MQAYVMQCREQGIETVIFGDIFLEDVRQYRERNLAQVGMRGGLSAVAEGHRRTWTSVREHRLQGDHHMR